jgi:hypothetical protein
MEGARRAFTRCRRLATATLRRGLYRLAAHFALPSAEAGDPDAMELLAALCEFRSASEDACGTAWRPFRCSRQHRHGDHWFWAEGWHS